MTVHGADPTHETATTRRPCAHGGTARYRTG